MLNYRRPSFKNFCQVAFPQHFSATTEKFIILKFTAMVMGCEYVFPVKFI